MSSDGDAGAAGCSCFAGCGCLVVCLAVAFSLVWWVVASFPMVNRG